MILLLQAYDFLDQRNKIDAQLSQVGNISYFEEEVHQMKYSNLNGVKLFPQ
jgi:flagellar hook-associated protein FlgK